MPQLHHSLVDIEGRRTGAAAAANCPAIGGRSGGRKPDRPFGQTVMSTAFWFRLLLVALILIGVVATLFRLAWSNFTAPRPILPKTGADNAPVDAAPARPTTAAPGQSGHIS